MKNLKYIFVLSLLATTLTGCWEQDLESNVEPVDEALVAAVAAAEAAAAAEAEAAAAAAAEEAAAAAAAAAAEAAANAEVALLTEEDDDITPLGNNIDYVSYKVVGDELLITQAHKAAKDAWHTIRVYVNTDDSDTSATPMGGGATELTGLVAEYGYIFEYTGEGWNLSKKNVDQGSWVDAETTATVTGGDTVLTEITIPLSEIGDPADVEAFQIMFVGTGTGWGTDQAPNDAMFQFSKSPVIEIVETDEDISPLGNDIDSVTVIMDDTNLVVTQTHKAAKDAWHTTRVYLNTDDSDTTTTPMGGGATSLTGLDAEYGYIFEYTGEGWNPSKKDVDQGSWVDAETTATATGGDSVITTITIPLSEIGNADDITTIKMMFVGTGTGWGTDQAPNDGMYQYADDDSTTAVTEIVDAEGDFDSSDGAEGMGNDIISVSVTNDETNLVITQTHVGIKGVWNDNRLYVNVNNADTMTTPMTESVAGSEYIGAVSLSGMTAEYGYIFEHTDAGGPDAWNTYKQEAYAGVWDTTPESVAVATGGDVDGVTTMTVPLSEIGSPAVGDTIQLMFVGTGWGWVTDQAPDSAMFDYVIEAP